MVGVGAGVVVSGVVVPRLDVSGLLDDGWFSHRLYPFRVLIVGVGELDGFDLFPALSTA